jgi:hypothetical protein
MDNIPASLFSKYGLRAVPHILQGDVPYTGVQQEITGELELSQLPGLAAYFRVLGGDGTTSVDLSLLGDVGDGQGFISLGAPLFTGFQGGQYGTVFASAFTGQSISVMDKIRLKAILNGGTPPTGYHIKVRGVLQIL